MIFNPNPDVDKLKASKIAELEARMLTRRLILIPHAIFI